MKLLKGAMAAIVLGAALHSIHNSVPSFSLETFPLHEVANSNPNNATTNISSPATPLLHRVAPTYFPMDPVTGWIQFPPEVDTLVIDVGARQSDYLNVLERHPEYHAMAVILVDPLPASVVPLHLRAARYATQRTAAHEASQSRWLDPVYKNRVFVVNAALGEREETTNFQVAPGPACSSLLSTQKHDPYWCHSSSQQQRVLVFTLNDLLALVPPNITNCHLKVDAEGADLMVLKGARDRIRRFETIIIECQDVPTIDDPLLLRQGACQFKEAREYMCKQQTFCQVDWKFQGPAKDTTQGNAFFRKSKRVRIPPFFVDATSPLQFKQRYLQFQKEAKQQEAKETSSGT